MPLLFALKRPVTIDDPLFLKAAEQIRRDPMRPLDVVTYWSGNPEPLWDVLKNPPGIAYWFALVEALGGRSELALHLAVLPFTVAAVLAGVWLAYRFAGDSPWITAVWVASPAFLVSASTLMADVPSLAFTLAGAAFYVAGVDRDRRGLRLGGAVLTGLAVITKYPALVAVPVLAAYPLLRASRTVRSRALVDLWGVAVPIGLWGLQNFLTHGRLHLLDSLVGLGEQSLSAPERLGHKLIATAAFLSLAGIFPVLFVAVALRLRGGVMLVLASVLTGLGAGMLAPSLWPSVAGWMVVAVALSGALGICAAASLARLALEAGRRDADLVFLAAWAAAYILFVAFGSWTVAARFLLPALPPLAWTLARALGARPGHEAPAMRRYLAPTTVVAFALAAVMLRADALPAEFQRDVIATVAERARQEGRRAHFLGAWSMLYYGERAGMRWLDVHRDPPRPGDLLVGAHYVSNARIPPELAGRLRKVADFTSRVPPLGIHTMNPLLGGGFYASLYGPLPFVLSRGPATGAVVYRID